MSCRANSRLILLYSVWGYVLYLCTFRQQKLRGCCGLVSPPTTVIKYDIILNVDLNFSEAKKVIRDMLKT